jgi:hypothetical protein
MQRSAECGCLRCGRWSGAAARDGPATSRRLCTRCWRTAHQT